MPTKGPRRAHEAFTTQPASGYAPTEDLDTSDVRSEPGRLGGGWVSDGGVNVGLPNHDVPPDWLRERADVDEPDTGDEEPASESAQEGSGAERNPERTYRGETVEVQCHNITGVREQADEDLAGFTTPVLIGVGAHRVAGDLTIQRQGRRVYSVEAAELSCECGEDRKSVV